MIILDTNVISVAEILYGIDSLPEGNKKRRLLEAAGAVFDTFFTGGSLALIILQSL